MFWLVIGMRGTYVKFESEKERTWKCEELGNKIRNCRTGFDNWTCGVDDGLVFGIMIGYLVFKLVYWGKIGKAFILASLVHSYYWIQVSLY